MRQTSALRTEYAEPSDYRSKTGYPIVKPLRMYYITLFENVKENFFEIGQKRKKRQKRQAEGVFFVNNVE